MSTEIQGINRRSLAKGAAWAAPAVLATAAMPAYAASMCGDGPFVYRSGGIRYLLVISGTLLLEGMSQLMHPGAGSLTVQAKYGFMTYHNISRWLEFQSLPGVNTGAHLLLVGAESCQLTQGIIRLLLLLIDLRLHL